jgi:hypothetical protein
VPVVQVVSSFAAVDVTSWADVSAGGELPQVLSFLSSHNPRTLDLSKVLWRASDPEWFAQLWDTLQKRRYAYQPLLAYSLLHGGGGNAEAVKAYCSLNQDRLDVGPGFSSPLLQVKPPLLHCFCPLHTSTTHWVIS